jgi:hypothetical protein
MTDYETERWYRPDNFDYIETEADTLQALVKQSFCDHKWSKVTEPGYTGLYCEKCTKEMRDV